MGDPINTLRGLSNENRARDEELRAGFRQLESRLIDASGGVEVFGRSENCRLARYGDDEAIYGYLGFSHSKLWVAYRSTEDDFNDAVDGPPHSDPTFSVLSLEKCDAEWLRSLAIPRVIESLMASINDAVRAAVEANKEAVSVLAAAVNFPTRSLEAALTEVSEELRFPAVLQGWRDAQSALGVDAADAATRACSLLETLCKHILQKKNQPMPQDQSIQKLFKYATRSLKLSPDEQSSHDLRAIASGLTTAVSAIGALRTHSGTAHGGTEDRHQITFSEARLGVNSAGVVATFLMEALLADLENAPLSPLTESLQTGKNGQ